MVITLLTGRRPELLERTLAAIADNKPSLFNQTFIVFNNAGDKETSDVLDRYELSNVIVNNETYPIGVAASLLAHKAYQSGEDIWLHLEDDWELQDVDWTKALSLIENKQVSQVRLRCDNETVLKKHMITGQPIEWEERDGYRVTDKAHYTMNPSLIRVEDIPKIFPCTGERDAQRNWLPTMKNVVQITPGMFKHIGDDNSLRLVTKCEV